MIVLFYFGWLLLVLAFIAGAAEAVVRQGPGGGMLVPAYDLWYTIWPGGLVITQIRIEKFAPLLWDPVLVTVLAIPAWALLAGPGVALTWYLRPNRTMTRDELEDARKHEESLMLYDELARAAMAEGADINDDDMAPDHSGHDALDAAAHLGYHSNEDLLAAINEMMAEETPDGKKTGRTA